MASSRNAATAAPHLSTGLQLRPASQVFDTWPPPALRTHLPTVGEAAPTQPQLPERPQVSPAPPASTPEQPRSSALRRRSLAPAAPTAPPSSVQALSHGKLLERWTAEAKRVAPRKCPVPLKTLAIEARTLADFVVHRWDPSVDSWGNKIPGLGAAAKLAGLELCVAREIEELAHLVVDLSPGLGQTPEEAQRMPARAQRVLQTLRGALQLLAQTPEQCEALAAVGRRSSDAVGLRLAMQLEGCLELLGRAETDHPRHATLFALPSESLQVLGLPDDLLDECKHLAEGLRRHAGGTGAGKRVRRANLSVRDGVATLLMDRMRRVRKVARFVYRDHPQLRRQSTSEYERQRKLRNNRRNG